MVTLVVRILPGAGTSRVTQQGLPITDSLVAIRFAGKADSPMQGVRRSNNLSLIRALPLLTLNNPPQNVRRRVPRWLIAYLH